MYDKSGLWYIEPFHAIIFISGMGIAGGLELVGSTEKPTFYNVLF